MASGRSSGLQYMNSRVRWLPETIAFEETNSIDTTPTPPIRRTIRRKSRSVTPAIGASHSGGSTATLPIFTILVMALILTAHHRLPSCGAAEEVGEEPGHDGPLEAAHQHAAGEEPAAAQLQEGERGGEIHPHQHV